MHHLMLTRMMDHAVSSKDFAAVVRNSGACAKVFGICMVIIVLMKLLIPKKGVAWFNLVYAFFCAIRCLFTWSIQT